MKSLTLIVAVAVGVLSSPASANAQVPPDPDPSLHQQYQLYNAGACRQIGDYGPCIPNGELPANAGWLEGPRISVDAVDGGHYVLVRKGASVAHFAYGEGVEDYGVDMTTKTVITLPVASSYYAGFLQKAAYNPVLGGIVGVRLFSGATLVKHWSSNTTPFPDFGNGCNCVAFLKYSGTFDKIEYYATGGMVLVTHNASVIYLGLPTAPADSTPPVITPTVSGTLGNNDWYRSNVSVTWTVADAESSVSASSCPSGNVTSDTGGTSFSCTATSDGGTSSESVTIKRDATNPTLMLPADITVPATGAAGATVSYSASASDAGSGVAAPTCAPASGATFAIGTTTVSCTAIDNAGNSASRSFTVTVQGPRALLNDLLNMVTGVRPGNSLRAKVLSAASSLDAGDAAAAADALRALIHEVRGQTGKKIAAGQAAAITALAQTILAML